MTQKCVNPDEPFGNQANICKRTFYGTLKSPIVKITNLKQNKEEAELNEVRAGV